MLYVYIYICLFDIHRIAISTLHDMVSLDKVTFSLWSLNGIKQGKAWRCLKIGQPKSLCLTHFKICEINSHHHVSNHQIPFITQIQTYTVYTINKYVFIIFSAIPWFFHGHPFCFLRPASTGPDPSTSPRRIMILRWTAGTWEYLRKIIFKNPSVSGSMLVFPGGGETLQNSLASRKKHQWWQWFLTMWRCISCLKMEIFHGHISLPECKIYNRDCRKLSNLSGSSMFMLFLC